MTSYIGNLLVGPKYRGQLKVGKLFINNDLLVSLEDLRDAGLGGTFLSGATATMVLLTTSGVTVSGVTFPVSLSNVTDSAGVYEGTLSTDELSLSEGLEYDLKITVTTGGEQVAQWLRRLIAVQRRT